MTLTKDKFLTEVIDKDVYKLDHPYTLEEINHYEIGKCMFYAKVLTSKIGIVNYLINKYYFRLMSTEVTFAWNKIPINYMKPDCNIEEIRMIHVGPYNNWLFDRVGVVASKAFIRDRFHMDVEIDQEIADKIKIKWVSNALFGNRGDCIAVAFDGIDPIGFLIVIEKEDKAIIDLIAVHPKYQGKGVGSDLMRWFCRKYQGEMLQVGTQIDNEASIKLYKKFGIDIIVNSNYVLHLHLR